MSLSTLVRRAPASARAFSLVFTLARNQPAPLTQDDHIRIWDFDTTREERERDAAAVALMLSGRQSPSPSPASAGARAGIAQGESEALSQPMRRLHIKP